MKNLDKELKNIESKSPDLKPKSKFISNFKRRKLEEQEILKDKAVAVLLDVCAYYSIPFTRVLSPYRGPKYVRIRKIACYLIKVKTNLPWNKIGEVMKIDRTSVNRNYSIIKEEVEGKKNTETKKDINNILLIIL